DGHVDPRPRRMEIEMPRPEAVAAVGRDRDAVRQQPVFVAEYLQGTRILWLAAGRIVAARDEDRQPVVRRDPYLVAVDSCVDRTALLHLLAQRRIALDPVDPRRARVVERAQPVPRRDVGGDMDGARRQPYRVAGRREGPRSRIDSKRADVVLRARRPWPGCAAAGGHVQISPGGMRPGVLHV